MSVALCTYNGARYLKDQLDSIASQTLTPHELVVCDDCSTDDTVKILDAFASRALFPVHLSINPTNLGSTKNFAQAIALCRGDIIALCDQDDVWHPAKLERLAAVFAASPDVQAAFSDARMIDEQSQPIGLNLWAALGFTEDRRRRVAGGGACAVLLKDPMVTGATLAFRRSLCDAILPIPSEWVHDAWISLIVAALGRMEPIAEPLIDYRQHGGQQIGARERMTRRGGGWVGRALAEFGANPREYVRRFDAEYARYAREYEIAQERLASLLPAHHPAVRGCGDKARHFRRRAGLSSRRWSRLPVVLRELIFFRYGRYSSGYRGAAKDLLRALVVWG